MGGFRGSSTYTRPIIENEPLEVSWAAAHNTHFRPTRYCKVADKPFLKCIDRRHLFIGASFYDYTLRWDLSIACYNQPIIEGEYNA